MAKNVIYGPRSSEIKVQNKPGLIRRVIRAYWDANQRTYLLATTDPVSGRNNLAMERQVALMMLG